MSSSVRAPSSRLGTALSIATIDPLHEKACLQIGSGHSCVGPRMLISQAELLYTGAVPRGSKYCRASS